MKANLLFEATITTKGTYPHCMSLKFSVEAHDSEHIFNEASEFVASTIRGEIVDITLECLGICEVRDASFWELTELAKQGLENVR